MILLRQETLERDFGWVFFYGPDEPSVVVAGNAPFIVDRNDGPVHVTGTAHPLNKYIWKATYAPDEPTRLRFRNTSWSSKHGSPGY